MAIPSRALRAGAPAAPPAACAGSAASRIVAFGRARLRSRGEYANIASAIGVAQYVAIASEIAATVSRGRVLDWGAGWGQNSLLLAGHGLEVVAYDVEDKGARSGLLAGTAVPYVVAPGPRLPFPDGAFDVALNCGVLEHVPDEAAALAELRRVLGPGGWLFTYHLPNRHAWTEWLGRRLGRFHHERTYRAGEAVALFEQAGFEVIRCRPFHLLPRNLWGGWHGRWADPRIAAAYERLDTALARRPTLSRWATAWSVVARRRP